MVTINSINTIVDENTVVVVTRALSLFLIVLFLILSYSFIVSDTSAGVVNNNS